MTIAQINLADDSGGVNGGDSSGVASVADKTFVKYYDGIDVLLLILMWPFKVMEQVHIKRDNMGELTKSQ